MTIVPTTVEREVVVEKTHGTTYVCDHCGERWVIGTYAPGVTRNSLHPPKAWWRVAPADSSTHWEDHRTKHFCSRECLGAWSQQSDEGDA